MVCLRSLDIGRSRRRQLDRLTAAYGRNITFVCDALLILPAPVVLAVIVAAALGAVRILPESAPKEIARNFWLWMPSRLIIRMHIYRWLERVQSHQEHEEKAVFPYTPPTAKVFSLIPIL